MWKNILLAVVCVAAIVQGNCIVGQQRRIDDMQNALKLQSEVNARSAEQMHHLVEIASIQQKFIDIQKWHINEIEKRYPCGGMRRIGD
jgi:hypothetical protein